MAEFLNKYYHIFLFTFPVLFLSAIVLDPLSYAVFFLIVLYQSFRRYDNVLIFTLLFIFILGDSRHYNLLFSKQLRIIIILFLGMITLVDLFQKKYKFRTIFLWIVPFFLVAILAAIRNPAPGLAFSKAISYFLLLFVALHFFDHHIKMRNKQFLWEMVVFGSLILFVGLALTRIMPGLVYFADSGRFRGVFGNPNGVGVYGTLMFQLFFLYFKFYGKQHTIFTKVFMWGVLLASILLCGSRNALISISLFLFINFMFKGGAARKILFFLLLIPLILFVSNLENIIAIVDYFGLSEKLRIQTILDGTGRFHAWTWGLEQYSLNPWIGRGFSYDEILFKDFMPEWLYITGHQGGTHNSYLSFLLNVGTIGLSIILIFYLRLLSRIKLKGAFLAILISCGFSAFFEPWLNSSLNAFTVHFLLVILFYTHIPLSQLRTDNS